MIIPCATKNKISFPQALESPEDSCIDSNRAIASKLAFFQNNQLKIKLFDDLERSFSLLKNKEDDLIINKKDRPKRKVSFVEIEKKEVDAMDFIEVLHSNDWRDCSFRSLVFNRDAKSENFYNHLIRTYEGLAYAKKNLKGIPLEATLEKKAVELKTINGNDYLKKKIIKRDCL